MSIGNKLEELKENEPLSKYTSFKIGGPAKYFYIAKTADDLVKAVKAAQEEGIDYYILGGGSNILVSDQGFDGLVIKLQFDNFEIENSKVVCGSGVNLNKLIFDLAEQGYGNLEFVAGIYGTVGGAVRGNAGAYGEDIGDAVEEVEVFRNGEIIKMTKDECKFSYRNSIFKDPENEDIILSATLKIEKGDKEEIKKKISEIIEKRNKKLPLEYPSAGCVFKNLEYNDELSQFKDWQMHGKIPVARFIDELGLKGKKIGGAQISEKHANFIINTGEATADNVLALISLIKMKVRDTYNVQLQEEIEYVGF